MHNDEDVIEAIITTPKYIITISEDDKIKIYDYNFKMICKQTIRISPRKNLVFKGDLLYFVDRTHNV